MQADSGVTVREMGKWEGKRLFAGRAESNAKSKRLPLSIEEQSKCWVDSHDMIVTSTLR